MESIYFPASTKSLFSLAMERPAALVPVENKHIHHTFQYVVITGIANGLHHNNCKYKLTMDRLRNLKKFEIRTMQLLVKCCEIRKM
jgi:hypothetical protein